VRAVERLFQAGPQRSFCLRVGPCHLGPCHSLQDPPMSTHHEKKRPGQGPRPEATD
jgi:hypothetical protein